MKNFVAIPDSYELWGQNFYNGGVKPVDEQINMINTKANECRWWYKPIFKDNEKYLPVTKQEEVKNPIDMINELKEKSAPAPPQQASINKDYTNLIIFGLGVIVVYKLLS